MLRISPVVNAESGTIRVTLDTPPGSAEGINLDTLALAKFKTGAKKEALELQRKAVELGVAEVDERAHQPADQAACHVAAADKADLFIPQHFLFSNSFCPSIPGDNGRGLKRRVL